MGGVLVWSVNEPKTINTTTINHDTVTKPLLMSWLFSRQTRLPVKQAPLFIVVYLLLVVL
jgi:hypothetical protein